MNTPVPNWDELYRSHPDLLVAELEQAYKRGSIAYTADDLANDASSEEEGFTATQATALLENSGPWLTREEIELPVDPDYPDAEPETVTQFVWRGAPRRRSGWLLLIHGMNTEGRWQEYLAFDIGLWHGRGTPTFIHKYGRIIVGVVMPWRRNGFKKELRNRMVELGKAAAARELDQRPDVVAHSFGTWLLGHVLLDELKSPTGIQVGRVILTGSILRPDFPWQDLQAAGLVEDVLNHYGTADSVVPWARWTIGDSGPSGRRGFDTPKATTPSPAHEVLNVVAPDFGHSEVFSDRERYESYSKTWEPFLRNPIGQASRDIPITNPTESWR